MKLHLLRLLYIKPRVMENWYYESASAFFAWYFVRYAAIGALLAVAYTMHRREQQRLAALQQTELVQAQLRQQMDEAHLQALSAQIEPHFLFNTLSNVIGMIRDQPAAAEKTLTDLTRLLRASLARTRSEHVTLDDELTILKALLEIHQIRMGSRLTWSVEVADDALRMLRLPPMLLQPIVENALQHGIEPLEEGGCVAIRIRREEDRLIATVTDTGAGPSAAHGHPASGVGLANVQSRLAALFGRAASLNLTENHPHGMVATLSIPVTGP
jgi:sensor histidine kinase YesM